MGGEICRSVFFRLKSAFPFRNKILRRRHFVFYASPYIILENALVFFQEFLYVLKKSGCLVKRSLCGFFSRRVLYKRRRWSWAHGARNFDGRFRFSASLFHVNTGSQVRFNKHGNFLRKRTSILEKTECLFVVFAAKRGVSFFKHGARFCNSLFNLHTDIIRHFRLSLFKHAREFFKMFFRRFRLRFRGNLATGRIFKCEGLKMRFISRGDFLRFLRYFYGETVKTVFSERLLRSENRCLGGDACRL